MLKNKKNGKIYVGQTIRSIEERFRKHKQKDSRCVALYNAIKKHGWDNFEKEWYEVPDDDLNFYEEMLVALLGTLSPSGYNLKEGGGSGGKDSNETKQKKREAHLGKKESEKTKQKKREANSGEKNHMYGKTGGTHPASKRVYQYYLDGAFINSFGSAGEAATHLKKKVGRSNISFCAGDKSGKHKTAYGFRWSYSPNVTQNV